MQAGRLYTPEQLRELLLLYGATHADGCAKRHISQFRLPPDERQKTVCTCGFEELTQP